MAYRQEALNVLLAQLLVEQGLVAAPEQVLKQREGPIKLPDVLVDFQGLRLVIEAEVGKSKNKQDRARAKAQERVDQSIAHVGVAVVYPTDLQQVKDFSNLKEELRRASLDFTIITDVTPERAQQEFWPMAPQPAQFMTGTVADLADSLRRSYEQLVKDDTLRNAVAKVEASIEEFVFALRAQPATAERMAQAVGVGLSSGRGAKKAGPSAAQRTAIGRIGALVLLNALIFQEVLSKKERQARPLHTFLRRPDLQGAILAEWDLILKINYFPIFHIAQEALQCLASDKDTNDALASLLETALHIVGWRAALRHDLAGRIYHRLLEEAKFLGAYYTAIPSAALLLKLGLRPDRYPDTDWSDLGDLARFHVSDLACGTGTLLMAAADVLLDNYIRACAGKRTKPDLHGFHKAAVENALHGYDVLNSAVHLTASTLALRVPDMPINVTHLWRMPLGGPRKSLGTLEFLEKQATEATLFSDPEQNSEQVVGKGRHTKPATIPELDLCVMNPPFTRSVGGNLLFGNLPEKERARMQARLKGIVSRRKVPASITAGLGSVFAALGHKFLKRGGRLCLVLPRALVSGVAWQRTRHLIARDYDLEYLIVSHEPGRWNFSENTSLSEVLVVAQKRANAAPESARTVCVNLWQQPRTALESLSLARQLMEADPPDAETGVGVQELALGDKKLGEAVSMPWPALRDASWNLPGAFAQTELVRALLHALRGRVYLPGQGVVAQVALCPLSSLGELGFDRRDIHDGFTLAKGTTHYPAFWCHEAALVNTLRQHPNQWLHARSRPAKGRPRRDAKRLWQKAGQVLLAERLRLNTVHAVAVCLTEKVLSNVWWTFVFQEHENPKVSDAGKALVLWLNSTIGIITLVGQREETEGAWVDFKKPSLSSMPVLDVWSLSAANLRRLGESYDQVADNALLTLGEMDCDTTRRAIDEALGDVLGLPDLAILRDLLAREPIIRLSLDRLISAP